jgi:superfamily II DNA or RNA helicase
MLKILINPQDKRYIFIVPESEADKIYIEPLEKHMNKIPQYMLLPTYSGVPQAEVFLDKFKGKSGEYIYYCAAGLWKEVYDFCTTKHIPADISAIDNNFKYTPFNLSKEQFKQLVAGWNLNLTPHDYQLDAAWLILKYNLSLSELATRAGKTLIFYIVARAAKEVLGATNVLMIVPSIHLVKQGVKDLQEYKDYFNCEQIWADGEQVSMADLTIGTFQSLIRKVDPRYKKYDPAFFDKFDVVCVDEAHKAPCKSIKTILALQAFKNLKLRFGFTGTLPKPNTIEWLACQAVLGPKIQEIRARELIEEGYLADPIIKQFRIKYNPASLQTITIKCAEYLLSNYIKSKTGTPQLLPEAQRQFTMVNMKQLPTSLRDSKPLFEPHEYVQHLTTMCAASSKTLNLEQLCAMFSKPRLDLMDSIVTHLNKNVIIFAHNVEYIKFLEAHYKRICPDKQVYKITGATTLKKRQQTVDKMLESDNCILIGSFAVVGTGITFRNVDYGIFAQSFKADTITRQSLGRLMLRTAEKSEFYLYDIIDEFPTKKLHNQALEKIRIYKSEGHRYEVIDSTTDFVELDPHNP